MVKPTVAKPTFVYVVYINSTAEKVWNALTDGEATRQYWMNHRNTSDWRVGSSWRHEDFDDAGSLDVIGTVVESDPPHRLVVTWADPVEAADPAKVSRVTYAIDEDGPMVRLTVTHDAFEPDSDTALGLAEGWPFILSSLKTLLETGTAMLPIWACTDARLDEDAFLGRVEVELARFVICTTGSVKPFGNGTS